MRHADALFVATGKHTKPLATSSPRAKEAWPKIGAVVSPRVTHLSPDADRVPDVVFAVGKLPDAIVDCNTALPGGQVLLCHLHPAQRTHSETLEGKGKNMICGLGSICITVLRTTR